MIKRDFLLVVKDLRSAFPQAYFLNTQANVDIWYDALKDLSVEAMSYAAKQYMKTGKEPPGIADIFVPAEQWDKAHAQKKEQDRPDPEEIFSYWVLEKLDGTFLNEVMADRTQSADDIAAYFGRVEDMSGTKIRRVSYRTYKPKHPEPAEPGTGDIAEAIQSVFGDMMKEEA